MPDLFEDAELWLSRARRHIEEFRTVNASLWRINTRKDPDGQFAYVMIYDRARATHLKIVAAEAANALFYTLDQIYAVGARQSNVKRNGDVSWPFRVLDDGDNTAALAVGALPRLVPDRDFMLARMNKQRLAPEWSNLVLETYDENVLRLAHEKAIKEVSNSGKHWAVLPTVAGAAAVSWHATANDPGGMRNIPRDYFDTNDEFMFYRGDEISSDHFNIVLSIYFVGPNIEGRPNPIDALDRMRGFVETALGKARALLANSTA